MMSHDVIRLIILSVEEAKRKGNSVSIDLLDCHMTSHMMGVMSHDLRMLACGLL